MKPEERLTRLLPRDLIISMDKEVEDFLQHLCRKYEIEKIAAIMGVWTVTNLSLLLKRDDPHFDIQRMMNRITIDQNKSIKTHDDA